MSREAFFFLCLRPIDEELRENDQISKVRDLCQLLHPSRKSQGFCLRGKREETRQKAEEFIPEKQEVAL